MKTSEFRALIREEVNNIVNEADADIRRSTQYPTIQVLRSALGVLSKRYEKNVLDKSKSGKAMDAETDTILAKYGLKKLHNFDQLYTSRIGKDPNRQVNFD
jgi:hypothetical protein